MLGLTSPGVSMGDSTAMTIEFLRARLLSERTVSRTAKQRAEQLDRRVVELEEQLKIMVIQRKKAEKAASQVLTILENREGDPTEVIDSSSDPDDDGGESKRNDVKEYETSNTSRVEKNELEDGLSGSEAEVSPSQGRSLSWKGRSSSPDSHEKQKMKYIRQRQRRSSFTSVTEPSEKHLSGRSCRKIKRKETRSTAEDGLDNHMLDEHGEGAALWSHHSDKQPKCPQEAPNNEMEEEIPHTLIKCSLDDQFKETPDNLFTNRREIYEEMERVLEKQARLIGQYEAEENAQRLWEEKYNENKSSTLSPGNQRNTAETHTELKAAVTDTKPSAENVVNTEELVQSSSVDSFSTVPTRHSIHSESNNEATATATVLSNGSVPPDPTRSAANSSEACSNGSDAALNHQHNGTSIQNTETDLHEFAFPTQESSNTGASYHINSSSNVNGNGIPGCSSSGSPSSVNSGNKFSKCQSLEMQNDLQRLPPQSSSQRLGGVLQALQHAKVALGQLGGQPLLKRGSLVTVAPTNSHVRTMDIPVVPTGLFSLPTDSYPQTSLSVPKVYTYADVGYGITSEFQYPTTYSETLSRVSVGRQYFDPYITSVGQLPSSTRHSLPYSHLTNERTSQDGFLRPGMDLRNELAARDRYNVYGNGNGGAQTDIRRQ